MHTDPEAKISSPWAPFKHRVFLVLWVAGLISNIGTWIFNVTSGWLMTGLTDSPLMVSLIQASTALPIFLFALPGGAFGDIFDRRKVLLYVQSMLAVVLLIFAILLYMKIINAWLLLFFTFLTGVGTAFSMPSWQATIPRLVPREALSSAIALNGINMNIARAIGPALGGIILLIFGAILAVIIDAVSYLVVVLALLWWRVNTKTKTTIPRERVMSAMKAGIRFCIHSKPLVATLIRSFVFFLFASAYWALLPLIAKDILHGGPGLYGILFGAIGVGAVGGAFLLPFMKNTVGPNVTVILGTLGTSLAVLLFALESSPLQGIFASLMAGCSWIMVVVNLSVSAQVALPDWVRSRGLAMVQVVFFGGMALGSVLWGQLAGLLGLKIALEISALLAIIALVCVWRWKLYQGEYHDYSPSHHWAEPKPAYELAPNRGLVLITIEYHIAVENRDLFVKRMRHLGKIRKRDGAIFWGIFEDIEKPGRYTEIYVDESWIAHLRKHERVSYADRVIEEKVKALHIGAEAPKVTHAVGPKACTYS